MTYCIIMGVEEVDWMKLIKILVIIAAIMAIAIAIPFILEHCVFRSNMLSVLTNGEWGGFLGSYIGGTFGGIGTIIAVYITTKQTRTIQQETRNQINEERTIRERQERKQFADEIARLISKYITDINNYFYSQRVLYNLYNQRKALVDELDHSAYNINAHSSQFFDMDVLKAKIEAIDKDIELSKIDTHRVNEYYYLLKIQLAQI